MTGPSRERKASGQKPEKDFIKKIAVPGQPSGPRCQTQE